MKRLSASPTTAMTAAYYTIVIAGMVTGLIGFVAAYTQTSTQPLAEVISPRAALTCLFSAMGLWAAIRSAPGWRVFFGSVIVIAAAYSSVMDSRLAPWLPEFFSHFAQPSVQWPVAVLYGLLGICILFGISQDKRRYLWRLSSPLLIVGGVLLSVLCWMGESYQHVAPHPMLASLASLLLVFYGVVLWLGSHQQEIPQPLPSIRALLTASLSASVITIIWFLLSLESVSRLENEGVRAVTEAGNSREMVSVENYRLMQRLVNRWQNISDYDLRRLMEMDIISYLNDIEQIESIMFLNQQGQLVWEETKPESESLSALLDEVDVQNWFRATERRGAVYIPTVSITEMQDPVILLKLPLFRYNGTASENGTNLFGYVLTAFNFARLVNPAMQETDSPFKTYAQVQNNYLLHSMGDYTEIRKLEDFSGHYLFSYQRTMRVPLGLELTLRGYLTNTTELRRAANLYTLVVGGGWILCVLLVISLENAAILRSQRAQLQFQASHDRLTGLANRTVLEEILGNHCKRIEGTDEALAVIFIDLDGFKPINDSLGLAVGDKLLIETANRIQKIMREGSRVARFGGDEFVVIVPRLSKDAPITDLVNDILSSIAQPYLIDSYRLYVTASIGITTTMESVADPKQLIQDADMAMYQAKRQGRNHYQFYTADISERFHVSVTIRNELQHVLEQNALQLFYQPIFSAKDHTIVGVEALLRWQREDGSYVSPAEFIPLAEDSGQIIPIGSWVLQQACSDGVRLQEYGDFQVAVNLSSIQVHRANFIESLKHTLNLTGFKSSKLNLELTESILMEDSHQAIRILDALRVQGFSVSIDDFGTGFSSLSYLKSLPIDTLKIDRSFIQDVISGKHDAAIARGIIAMASQLDLNVVAEGVETAEQVAFVEEAGCHYMQGFYFARPMPFSELICFIQNYKAKRS
ncbi:bifunctional diguanylate cyclase/phosphodiesterase [Aliidiomarina halalkaliphila]|uniref:Bifunctional diguanylate cyclase/phosphodiesterase n=1 Tax=Aliidiomarina halalkaliphila TaxID=2593535 RepID=A0A552X1U3_9GAMM|nr:bifunctional diguanylate cyclase/phosphodiesterase [Aliidiomarina halalkaliphila]TRW49018.1 bifunctional diguanylate cyclase/phosphodiesterase [Aliidiomarina halalkaliphila]